MSETKNFIDTDSSVLDSKLRFVKVTYQTLKIPFNVTFVNSICNFPLLLSHTSSE